MFDQGLQNTVPLLPQRCNSMSRHWHSSVLLLHADTLETNLCKVDLVCVILVGLDCFKVHEFVLLVLGEVGLIDFHFLENPVDFGGFLDE